MGRWVGGWVGGWGLFLYLVVRGAMVEEVVGSSISSSSSSSFSSRPAPVAGEVRAVPVVLGDASYPPSSSSSWRGGIESIEVLLGDVGGRVGGWVGGGENELL